MNQLTQEQAALLRTLRPRIHALVVEMESIMTEGLEGDDPDSDANGYLIAAAPDMLSELQAFCEHFAGYYESPGVIGAEVTPWLNRFRPIIKDATNGT